MLTAKLIGEGYSKPNAESELPIDINYAKLNEWLVDRKQVPADWNRKLAAIQAKAAEALAELPPGFMGQLEGGEDAPLDYFAAQQVLCKLTETAEKGFLGGLKGTAGSWDKVVRAYEYNLIYLAEAAQTVCRNADFEIPFFKKQAAKHQQQLADLERRKAEAQRSAAAAATEFLQECQQLGIDSGDIRGGLLGLTAELPALAGGAVESLQAEELSAAIDYYSAVTGYQQGGAAAAAGVAGGLLPTLAEVREGRTEAPAAAAAGPAASAGGDGSSAAGLQVEWALGAAQEAVDGGPPAAAGGAAAGISWDLSSAELAEKAGGDDGGEAAAAAAGGISWDFEVEAEPAATAGGADEAPAGADGAPAEVSWDIDISGLGEAAEQQQQGGGGRPSSGVPAGAAAGAAGPTAAAAVGGGAAATGSADEPATVRRLVEDVAYRASLLDDLSELRAFLMQRCRELSGKSAELLVAGAPQAVQHVDADAAGGMLGAVNAALAAFSGDKLKQLISLRTSARHLDRLAAGLHQKAGQEAKFHRAAAEAEQRRGDIQRQLMADSAKLGALVRRTRQAKEAAEGALSAKLGRRINIMGEVNQLI